MTDEEMIARGFKPHKGGNRPEDWDMDANPNAIWRDGHEFKHSDRAYWTHIGTGSDIVFYKARRVPAADLTTTDTATLIAELRKRDDLPEGCVLPEPGYASWTEVPVVVSVNEFRKKALPVFITAGHISADSRCPRTREGPSPHR